MRLRDSSIVTAQLLDGLASNLPARLLIEFRWSPKKRSLTHPADERSNQRWSGYGEGARYESTIPYRLCAARCHLQRKLASSVFGDLAVIETIGNLGAVYLAFKAADLVFTYFVIRFIWRRRKWRLLSFRE